MDNLIPPEVSNAAHENKWCRTCNNLASYSCFDEGANHLISTLAEALRLIKSDIDGNLGSARHNLAHEQTRGDKADIDALQTKIDRLEACVIDIAELVQTKKNYLRLLQEEKQNKITLLNNFKSEMTDIRKMNESISDSTTERLNGSITVSLIDRLQRLTALYRRANYVSLNAHHVGTFSVESNKTCALRLQSDMIDLATILYEQWF